MREAVKKADFIVTVTGNTSVVRKDHFKVIKDGAVLANSGHFNVEINLNDLETLSKKKREIRKNVTEYTLYDGRRIYVL